MVDDANARIDSLWAEIDDQTSTIATHEATIEGLRASNDSLNSTIEAQGQQILELEERLKARCSCQGAKIDEKE